MSCFAPATASGAILLLHPPNISSSNCKNKKKKNCELKAKLNDYESDPLLQSAINAASLRFQESNRSDPLYFDPYAGCFINPNVQKEMGQSSLSRSFTSRYSLATKFIDDKLLTRMSQIDDLRQVVLFTDGMDTRPYRLKWPNSTIIFDISPGRVFQVAAQKLKDVGAKIPRSCLLIHVPSDSFDKQDILYRKGFNGSRPSIWVMQGLPLLTLEKFKDIVILVSSLATKGDIFLGEVPAWLVESEAAEKGLEQLDSKNWMDKFFMSNGFKVDVVSYDEVARNLGRDLPSGDQIYIPFVAEQLRLSDGQMENWRRVLDRVEEDGDEDGFEEF